MNYANMIEEKKLKKTFIIATLCSTLIGTFTTSINLWDRVNEKRLQKKRDSKQDQDIKKLKAQVEEAENRKNSKRNDRKRDDVGASLERSGAFINREYEEGYARLGRRFAVGDVVTENKLQAQVIALQQTVINILQDALYNGRELNRVDVARMVAASTSAREGSIDALRQQRQRQLLATEAPSPPHAVLVPPKHASTILEVDPLFCRYSLDLQYIRNKPLAATFAPGGSCRCPACGVRLAVESDDVWEISKQKPLLVSDGGYEREFVKEKEFHLGQRFVIKCHMPDGEFACVLCNRNRDKDIICPTVESLVNHVGRAHDVSELECEVDFERRSKSKTVLLALPPAPSPPSSYVFDPIRLAEDRRNMEETRGLIIEGSGDNF